MENKFQIGQIVRGRDNAIYRIEELGRSADGRQLYLTKQLVTEYSYQTENELEEFYGTVPVQD